MEKLNKFVSEHIADDIARLILDRNKWPGIDMDLAVSCIESRRKLKGKIQEWYDQPDLIFPIKLSAEQCSSSATGRYKAIIADQITESRWRLADLTGGLGVDSWFFAQKAEAVLYNEMQKPLCQAAEHNFKALGMTNITISNHAISNTDDPATAAVTPTSLLKEFRPDIVYMDPARRGDGGKKVFLIEDCTPDVLTLKDEIFTICRHILIKLSPMADISMLCDRLGKECREVHVIASGSECKELLIWMDKEWNDEYSIKAVEIHNDGTVSDFTFKPSEERSARAEVADMTGSYLFEPGKALMKSGAFNLISQRSGVGKLGVSTHYFLTDDLTKVEKLQRLGKIFMIKEILPLDKRSIKQIGKKYPKAEVTARNIPMDTDTLRKKLGVTSGDDAHIFGLKSDINGNILIAAKKF